MTKKFHSFIKGFLSPIDAAAFLWKTPNVKRVALLPVLLSFVLMAIGTVIFLNIAQAFSFDPVEWTFWGGGILSALINFSLTILKWVLVLIGILLLSWILFGTVGLFIGFPLMDFLSVRVEQAETEPCPQLPLLVEWKLRLLKGGFLDSMLLNGWWTFLGFFAFLGSWLLPVIGQVVLVAVLGWSFGVMFLDIPMARNLLRNRHKRLLFKKEFWTVWGLGVSMSLLFMVPYGGALLALPLGVTAATRIYTRGNWSEWIDQEQRPEGFYPPQLKIGADTESETEVDDLHEEFK